MLQSQLFFKTLKETPADSDSTNASYLVRACMVQKQMAGVYALLPLGLKVSKKIEQIIREEMNVINGQELLMNVFQPKELWEETGRWSKYPDVMYQFKDTRDKELGLGWTHEEQIVDIVRKKIKSYKDLPLSLYQFQTKFRNEARAKSGLLRGREFIMKDMYSFHANEADFDEYYEKAKQAYFKVFKRLGLDAKYVQASGGAFSKASDEFQVISPVGEDTIFHCDKCDFAQNNEVATIKVCDKCPKCDGKIEMANSIEVGNIFPLGDNYTKPMNATFIDTDGKEQTFIMGCYGIGITRALATIVEVYYDSTNNKMNWPKSVAPFEVHLISLGQNEEAEKIYQELKSKNIDVLYDDRDSSAGAKFAEADLLGAPTRIIVSRKTVEQGGVEMVVGTGEAKIVKFNEINL
jgi:prolyl-tRNA synthetase